MTVLILAIAYPLAIAVLFYLAFLRPVQQHQKRQRQELASLASAVVQRLKPASQGERAAVEPRQG